MYLVYKHDLKSPGVYELWKMKMLHVYPLTLNSFFHRSDGYLSLSFM